MQTNPQEKRRIRWVCGNTCLAPSEAREAQGLRRRCAGVSTMVVPDQNSPWQNPTRLVSIAALLRRQAPLPHPLLRLCSGPAQALLRPCSGCFSEVSEGSVKVTRAKSSAHPYPLRKMVWTSEPHYLTRCMLVQALPHNYDIALVEPTINVT
jgi:hypothetical protein